MGDGSKEEVASHDELGSNSKKPIMMDAARMAPPKPSLTTVCSFWARLVFYVAAVIAGVMVVGALAKSSSDLKTNVCNEQLCILSFDIKHASCGQAAKQTNCHFCFFAGAAGLSAAFLFLLILIVNMCKKHFAPSRLVLLETVLALLLTIVFLSMGILITVKFSQYCKDIGHHCAKYLDEGIKATTGRSSSSAYLQLEVMEAGSWMGCTAWGMIFLVTFCRWRVASKKGRVPQFDNPNSSEA